MVVRVAASAAGTSTELDRGSSRWRARIHRAHRPV